MIASPRSAAARPIPSRPATASPASGSPSWNATEGTSLRYATQLRYRWRPELEPGIEAYGEPGGIADFKPTDQQTHQLGPVIFGRLPLGPLPGELKYEVGYLFGLTPGTPEGNVKWRLEYEFRF